jgi:hypothetical protein
MDAFIAGCDDSFHKIERLGEGKRGDSGKPDGQDVGPAGFRRLILLGCGLAALASSCNTPPAVNPWVDDSIPEQKWYTPSSESVLVARAEPSITHRKGPTLVAPTVDPNVPHYPLWWEDSFEEVGDKDGYFAWTWVDYFAMPASYGRFWVNTLGFPASIIVDPPGAHMISDGIPERRGLCEQDSKRGYSNDPNATMRDFSYEGGDEVIPAASSAPAE